MGQTIQLEKKVINDGVYAVFSLDPQDEMTNKIAHNWPRAFFNNHEQKWMVKYDRKTLNEFFVRFRGFAYVDYSAFRTPVTVSSPRRKSEVRDVVKLNVSPADLSDEIKRSIEVFEAFMNGQRYSDNTIRTYVSMLWVFFRFVYPKQANEIELSDLYAFNSDYILANNYSISYQNQMLNALKIYFYRFHSIRFDLSSVDRARKTKPLPVILSLPEVESILKSCNNLKHKAMLSTVYGCGLRSGELLQIKLKDIDRKRGVIHIQKAKGAKDRIVPLPKMLLPLLEAYYRQYKPKKYLFEGATGDQYSKTSLAKVFKRSVNRAGIKKSVSLHSLRHSFATHLLEAGINLRYIQSILGHSSSRTTEIYTRVTADAARNVASPLEKIDLYKK